MISKPGASSVAEMDRSEKQWTPARDDCLHPELWTTDDAFGTEHQVTAGVGGLIAMLQPDTVVETGTYYGQTTFIIAQFLAQNGHGFLWTIDSNEKCCETTRRLVKTSRVKIEQHVEVICSDSTDEALKEKITRPIDFLWVDGGDREAEIRFFYPMLSNRAVICVHDTRRKAERYALRKLRAEGLIAYVNLPTPRGIAIARPVRYKDVFMTVKKTVDYMVDPEPSTP